MRFFVHPSPKIAPLRNRLTDKKSIFVPNLQTLNNYDKD